MIPLTSEDNKQIEIKVGFAILTLTNYGEKPTTSEVMAQEISDATELRRGLEDLNSQGYLTMKPDGNRGYRSISPKNGLREHIIHLQDQLQNATILKAQVKFNRVIAFTGAILAMTAILSFLRNEGMEWNNSISGLIAYAIILIILVVSVGYLATFIWEEIFGTKR